MSEAGSLSEYTPSADEMVRALSYWGHMTREEARAAVNRRIDFIEAAALREAADEIADLYFGPDQDTPFTTGRAHKWGSDTAAARLRARADRIESQEDENDE